MDGAELVRSASAGSVSSSNAILERHAARVDDLVDAMLGHRTATLEADTAAFLEASLRLYGTSEEDGLGAWLLAVTHHPAAPSLDPTPPPPPPAPVLVLKVAPPQQGAAGAEPAVAASPPPPPPPPAPPSEAAGPVPAHAGDGDRIASSTPTGTGPGRRGPAHPGRWAAASFVGAALLLFAAFLVNARSNGNTALRADSTATTAAAATTTLPEATGGAVEPGLPTPTTPGPAQAPGPAASVPNGAATTAPAGPTTAASAPPAAGPGALFPTLTTVGLPAVDTTMGVVRGPLPLRNRGQSPLTYTTRSSFAGLSVNPPTGTIAPGATSQLTVTLDGTKAGEGPFTGSLTFDGSGGTQQVAVTSLIGRPPVINDGGETCPAGAQACSQLIQLVPGASPDAAPTPCNTPWRYSVTIEDESRLSSVRAVANLEGRSAPLMKDGAPRGPAGRWQSEVFPPLQGPAALRFTIEAADEFSFGRSRPAARTIEC